MLGENVVDHVSVNIGESHVSPAKTIGQAFVVHSELVQHCGMEVVDLHFVFNGLIAEVIGRSINGPALDASTGHPH